MGVPPEKQGGLYWFQQEALIREYQEQKKFNATISGMKMK